jgi:opacity protein-like surface antigen
MRTLTAASLAALAIPTVANATETYIGLSGGIAMPSDSENVGAFDATVPATMDWGEIPAGTSLAWDTEFGTGFAISGQLGVKLDNGLRGEVEVSYTDTGVETHRNLAAGGAVIDGVDVAVLTRGAPDAANPTVGQVIASGEGSVSTFGVFLNGFYDIDAGGGFEPYLGAGIGYQSVDVNYMPSGVGVADAAEGGFAWQVMAGATVPVSDGVDLFGQYTYRANAERADVPLDLLPATLGVQSNNSLVTVGLRVEL